MKRRPVRIKSLPTLAALIAVAAIGAHARAAVVVSLDFFASTGGASTVNYPTSPISGDTTITPATNKTNLDGIIFTGQVGVWNAMGVVSNNQSIALGATTGFLLDGSGAATTIQFTRGGYRASTLNGDAALLAFSDLRREAPRLHSTLFASTTWSITGLDPLTEYELVLFGSPTNISVLANAIAGVRDTEDDLNFASIFSDAAGAIVGTAAITALPQLSQIFTAFQIQKVEVVIPTPAAAPAGLALLTLASLRRRRRPDRVAQRR